MTAPYNPSAAGAGSSTDAGPTDIWGLGTKGKSPVFLGTVEAPFGGRKDAPAIFRANEATPPPPPAGGYGPQFTTALEAMQQLPKLYAANRAGYIALQQKLFDAGFFGTTDARSIGVGAYNAQTVNAYRSAVLAASQLADSKTPVTFDELLAQKNPAAGGHRAKQVQPGFVAQYSDPQTVAAIAQQAAQTSLGRNLSTGEVQAYVAEFHKAEQSWNANQKAAATTAQGGHDAATTSAPSAQATADSYMHQGGRGVEATGNKLADYANVLRGLVGGGV